MLPSGRPPGPTEPTVDEDGHGACGVGENTLVNRSDCRVGLLHATVHCLLFVKWENNQRDMLVLSEVADVFMHGGVRGHGGEGLDRDAAGVLLVVLERSDDVLGLSLAAVRGAKVAAVFGGAVVVDDEHGGGTTCELDEVESVDEDGRALGWVGGFEQAYDHGDVARVVEARHHAELGVGLGSL